MKIPSINRKDNTKKGVKLNFSEEDIKNYNIYTNLLRKELYNINTYITRLIMHYKKEIDYVYNVVDIRVLYEELINLFLSKLMIYAQETKEHNIQYNNEIVDNSRENNKVRFRVKMNISYNPYELNNYFDNADIFEDVNNSLLKTVVYLGQITDIEANAYVKVEGLEKDKTNINDYTMLYNDQLYKYVGNFLMICNLCKNQFLKDSIEKRANSLNK